jgi:hypothetical protein
MKGLVAAAIAALLLYTIDFEFNDGRYSQVVKQAAKAVIWR